MKHLVTLIASIFATSSFATAAMATTVDRVVLECIHETRAPGSYSIVGGGSLPVVAPGAGASQASAAAVNDCLLDKYQVQFAAVSAAPAARTQTVVRGSAQSHCQRLLNRSAGEAFARSVGTSILVGGLGAGIHASTVTANFQRCIRSGAYGSGAALSRGGTGVLISNCRAGGGVFQAGTSICPGQGG